MRISACIIGAVAAKEMGAGRDPVVGHLVRHVTIVALRTSPMEEQAFADGNFLGIVGVATVRAKRAGACEVLVTEAGVYRMPVTRSCVGRPDKRSEGLPCLVNVSHCGFGAAMLNL